MATEDEDAPTWFPGPAWLFCPADRPDRYPKALAAADVVIVDLEDAVAEQDKDRARAALRDLPDLQHHRTVVRVNAAGTEYHRADLDAVRMRGIRRIMLPKAETLSTLDAVDDLEVVVLVESPRGVEAAGELGGHTSVIGMLWGAEDLAAGLGGTTSRFPDGRYRDPARFARARTMMAAKANGRFVLDAVHIDHRDVEGLRAECEDAAAIGFDGTAAIHPTQVPVIRDAYRPTSAQLDRARRILAASEGAAGAFTFEGAMVDRPLLLQARRLVQRGRVG